MKLNYKKTIFVGFAFFSDMRILAGVRQYRADDAGQ